MVNFSIGNMRRPEDIYRLPDFPFDMAKIGYAPADADPVEVPFMPGFSVTVIPLGCELLMSNEQGKYSLQAPEDIGQYLEDERFIGKTPGHLQFMRDSIQALSEVFHYDAPFTLRGLVVEGPLVERVRKDTLGQMVDRLSSYNPVAIVEAYGVRRPEAMYIQQHIPQTFLFTDF